MSVVTFAEEHSSPHRRPGNVMAAVGAAQTTASATEHVLASLHVDTIKRRREILDMKEDLLKMNSADYAIDKERQAIAEARERIEQRKAERARVAAEKRQAHQQQQQHEGNNESQ